MRILHFSTYEKMGGAARAAYRLHHALRLKGHDSKFFVSSKISDDHSVIGPPTILEKAKSILSRSINNLFTIRYRNKPNNYFTSARFSPAPYSWHNKSYADIINLHWIGDGFFRIESFAKINKPIIWTLHDSWAFTGGCHIPYECKRYQGRCGKCPALASTKTADLSAKILARKKKEWNHLDLTLVSPSNWLAECVKSSSLFHNRTIHVIPNGVDTNRFKPMNRDEVRGFLSLPNDKKLIMTGAVGIDRDKNKGFHLLREALQHLYTKLPAESIELIVFGMSEPKNPPDLGLKTHYIGRLEDEISLALLYNAADVFIVPSIQESFGLTALEALSCGVPVVCFNTSGLRDVVDHKETGYLARQFDTDDLASGITDILNNTEYRMTLSEKARDKVTECFSIDAAAEKYIALYKDILDHQESRPLT